MKVLITGAFGFVGSNLSAFLAEKGHELWALDVCGGSSKVLKCGLSKVENTSSQDEKTLRSAYVRRFNWDQLEQIPWNEVDAVIHLAGKAHDTKNASDPQSYFDVNVGLTHKIVSSLVHHCESAFVAKPEDGGPRTEDSRGSTNERMSSRTKKLPTFILFSSVKAAADRVEGVLTEETAPEPKTAYGQSKLAAEEVVRSALSRGRALSSRFSDTVEPARSAMEPLNQAAGRLNYYILRPCMIHGPGNKGNLNLLYGMVGKGVPWPLGAFENRRSFASVGNVCAVVEGLLAGSAESGVYQVADDEPLSTNELVRLMAEAMGRRARVWAIPAGLIRAAARLGDVLHLPLNSERLKKLTESYVVSNAKIKGALGWAQMPAGAREGMRKTLESF